MATSMQRVNSVKVLCRYFQGIPCQATFLQHQRGLHQITCATTVAAQCRLLQQHRPINRRAAVNLVSPCRAMCKYRPAKELYKTLYEHTHPFYKIIKYKRKKYVPPHPLPMVKDPAARESSVLLYDDEEILRTMGKAYLADKPVDDVYVVKHYPPQLSAFREAIDKLRAQDKWDFCQEQDGSREVKVTFVLDGKLEKEKKVSAFQGFLTFPHQFTNDNRVLCFVEDADKEKAREAGAYIVAGRNQVSDVVDRKIRLTEQVGVYSEVTKDEGEVEESEVQEGAATSATENVTEEDVEYVDYVVASHKIIQALNPLKRVIRHKFPTAKKGSVDRNIEKAVRLYLKGTTYESHYTENKDSFLCETSIGKLDLTNEQLEENLTALIDDICLRKPLKFGPFITEISVTASHLDTYTIESAHYLPQPELEEELSLAQELELLEKEMAQQRVTQT